MPNPPKASKPTSNRSQIVVLALTLIIIATGIALSAVLVPLLAPLAIVVALSSVLFAVLSLRENL